MKAAGPELGEDFLIEGPVRVDGPAVRPDLGEDIVLEGPVLVGGAAPVLVRAKTSWLKQGGACSIAPPATHTTHRDGSVGDGGGDANRNHTLNQTN